MQEKQYSVWRYQVIYHVVVNAKTTDGGTFYFKADREMQREDFTARLAKFLSIPEDNIAVISEYALDADEFFKLGGSDDRDVNIPNSEIAS